MPESRATRIAPERPAKDGSAFAACGVIAEARKGGRFGEEAMGGHARSDIKERNRARLEQNRIHAPASWRK